MRIDIQYIKDFLEIILDHDSSHFTIDIPKIKLLWSNDDKKWNKLVFHMEILEDQNLIESAVDSYTGIGVRRASDGSIPINAVPLRLTAEGHQFALDLSKPGVIDKLITHVKYLGPIELIKMAFELGKEAMEYI